MKRSILMLMLIAAAPIFLGCEKEESPSTDPTLEIASIKAVYEDITTAVKDGSTEDYVSNFTPDVINMPPGFSISRGKEELRTTVEGMLAIFDAELPYTVEEVEVVGDWAFVSSAWEYRLTPKAGGETTISYGKELDVMQKQADGSWKIHRQCYNYDPVVK